MATTLLTQTPKALALLGQGALQGRCGQVHGLRTARQITARLAGEPLREVARACGFAELSPFYRAFRRWYGQTPEQYRQAGTALGD